ncbi:MAG: hypothetical protein EA422_08045 [Gemmatimonadales bacterium]|nr:MAG: hypothetical protein EA422_08045 [Gemmatimonadales bacterium]
MAVWKWVAAGVAALTVAMVAREAGAQESGVSRGPGEVLSGGAGVGLAGAVALERVRTDPGYRMPPDVEALVHRRIEAERAHLRRVGWWGATNLAAGVALWTLSPEEDRLRRAFGMQTAGWGAVNAAIAVGGLRWGGGDPPDSPGAALAAESRYAHILLVNLGLNVGYMGVGATLATVGRGHGHWDERKGHGSAVVIQGLGLLALDLVAYMESRGRLGGFQDILDRVEVRRDGAVRVRLP